MINTQDLPGILEQALPELSGICKRKKCRNVYDMMRQMIVYTHTKVIRHNIKAARKCLNLAEQLYNSGNAAVRSAIENVFVYSFSRTFFYDEKIKNQMTPILPPFLYELYKKQVVSSHL